MPIRATYLLPAETSCQQVCFYIPYDGYPEGAATYFYKMYQCENKQGGYAECFLRANSDAKFTKNHEARVDTEFRYTINVQNILSVWKKAIFANQWSIIYEGPWYQFVNKYLRASEHLYLFRLSKNREDGTIMTISKAQRWIKAFKNSVCKVCP